MDVSPALAHLVSRRLGIDLETLGPEATELAIPKIQQCVVDEIQRLQMRTTEVCKSAISNAALHHAHLLQIPNPGITRSETVASFAGLEASPDQLMASLFPQVE